MVLEAFLRDVSTVNVRFAEWGDGTTNVLYIDGRQHKGAASKGGCEADRVMSTHE